MVILNEGLNRIRDLINSDVEDALAGTDGTPPTEANTGLVAPIAATEADVTTTVVDKSLQVSHTIPSTTATGNTFKEWSTRGNSEATDYNRAVTAGVSHTANDDVTRITTWFLING